MSRESLSEFLRSEELRLALGFMVVGIGGFRVVCWVICKLFGWL